MIRIDLQHVTKSFKGQTVIEDVSLTVPPGQALCLLGPSGVGKSTLLKMIAGLFAPDRGDILFDGESVLSVPVEKRGAVLVFQDYSLFPHMTVGQNIAFGLRMAGRPKVEQERVAEEMLDLVEMAGTGGKFPRELSGGQQQRVALARALAIGPKVLLLDEPFSNLDTRLRASMRDFTRRLQKRLGITTILVTHDCEEALMLSDRIAMVLGGRVRQVGTPEDVYRSPASPGVASFFGPRNYFKGEVTLGVLHCPLGEFPFPDEAEGRCLVMARPDSFRQAASGGFTSTVKEVSFAGDKVHYVLELEEGPPFRISLSPEEKFREGETVRLDVSPGALVLFPMQADPGK